MWEKVDKDDPRRCQGVKPLEGQCSNKAVEGSNFCPAHGGNKGAEALVKKELRNYRLAQFRSRLVELGDNENIINLRDEIAILRYLIEEKMNMCKNSHDLILMSGPLSDLVMKVEKLVNSCNRLESKLGGLLDRAKVLQFAQTIVQIISKYIKDEEALDAVAEEILTTLKN